METLLALLLLPLLQELPMLTLLGPTQMLELTLLTLLYGIIATLQTLLEERETLQIHKIILAMSL
jgi:hypothetical protein